MKALFTFLFIAFFGFAAAAQQPETTPAAPQFERFRSAGLKGGVNLASVSRLMDSDIYLGLHAGVYGDVRASETFGYGGELLFNNQGVMVNNIDFSFNYLTLPVFFNLHNGRATLQLGGYGSFLMKANVREFQVKQDITSSLASTDCGLLAGVKIRTSGKLALGARFYLGVQNINNGLAKPYGITLENRNLQISLHYGL